jgi:hypothetical protein
LAGLYRELITGEILPPEFLAWYIELGQKMYPERPEHNYRHEISSNRLMAYMKTQRKYKELDANMLRKMNEAHLTEKEIKYFKTALKKMITPATPASSKSHDKKVS